MAKKKSLSLITTITLVLVLFATLCLIKISETNQTVRTTTVNIERQAIDYQSVLDEFENAELEKEGSLTTFVGYKSIKLAELDGLDLVNETDVDENTEFSVKYNFSYDSKTNIVTLSAELKDEFGEIQVDTLHGAAFINEYGEIDAVMNVDGEGILLSEMQDAGLIANCGWFSRLIRKIVKVVAIAVVTAVVVTTAVATAGAVVATGVGVVTSGVTASAVAGTAIATGAAAAAVTAGVGLAIAIGETIVENADGSVTINKTYRIGKEQVDENTIDLIRKVSKTATLATLRELTRAYHIAFAVSQSFTENGKTYNVGDLYISKESLTFDEAYAILISSGIIDNLHDVTKNIDLINSINNVLNKNNVKNLADLVKEYTNKGYFKKKASGIYADSEFAATALAVVTGAWIKGEDKELYAYGGAGGYYHFHDFNKTIHIWYGGKIAW